MIYDGTLIKFCTLLFSLQMRSVLQRALGDGVKTRPFPRLLTRSYSALFFQLQLDQLLSKFAAYLSKILNDLSCSCCLLLLCSNKAIDQSSLYRNEYCNLALFSTVHLSQFLVNGRVILFFWGVSYQLISSVKRETKTKSRQITIKATVINFRTDRTLQILC